MMQIAWQCGMLTEYAKQLRLYAFSQTISCSKLLATKGLRCPAQLNTLFDLDRLAEAIRTNSTGHSIEYSA